MSEIDSVGQFADTLSATLESLIAPYEGQARFQNLARDEEWPMKVQDYAFWWRIHYGKRTIWFGYDGRRQAFDVYDTKLVNTSKIFRTKVAEEAFGHFRQRIGEIPNEAPLKA